MFNKRAPQTRQTSVAGGAFALDPLESRTLLSTNFSWVGVDLSPNGNSVVFGDGVLAADNSVTGSTTVATLTGTQTGQSPDIASVSFAAGGVMSITRAAGLPTFGTQSGTDFRSTASQYILGVHAGTYDADGAAGSSTGEFDRMLVERRPIFSSYRSSGRMVVRVTNVSASGVTYFQRGMSLVLTNGQPTGVLWYQNPFMSSGGVFKTVTSATADGVVTFGNGEKLVFMRGDPTVPGEQQAVYFDGDSSDGSIGYGLATTKSSYAQFVVPSADHPRIIYRGVILAGGAEPRAVLGITDPSQTGQSVVLELLADAAEFKMYRAAEYDAGGASPIFAGGWSTTGYSELYSLLPSPNDYINQIQYLVNQLRLVDNSGRELVLSRSVGFTLAGAMYRATQSDTRYLIGGELTTQSFALPQTVVNLDPQALDIDQNGHPIVYGLAGGSTAPVWYKKDLATLLGGKGVSDSVLSRTDSTTTASWTVVGIATDGDVVLYRIGTLHSDFKGITFEDVTETAGSPLAGIRFTSQAAVFIKQDSGVAVVAGKTVDGKLIVATLDMNQDAPTWTVTDVGASMVGTQHPIPDWVGTISGYTTPWDAITIAGFNASGEMEVVWTAPEAHGWFRSNLSLIAGAPALGGKISTLVSGWGAIQMQAIAAGGDLISVWWAPEKVGSWSYQNLTAEAGAAKLAKLDFRGREATMNAWSFGSTLNVTAIDINGATQVYWWSLESPTWHVTNVNPPYDPINTPGALLADVRDIQRYAHHQFFALNTNGELLRIYWHNSPKDEWIIDNVGVGAI